MGITFYFDWEVRLMEVMQSIFSSDIVVKIISLITMLGEEYISIAIIGFLYWGYDKELGKTIGINVYATQLVNPMLKNVLLRRRPYFDNPSIKLLKKIDASADAYDISAQGYSFPSGHSSNAATLYGSLGVYGKKRVLRILAVLLPLLVGFTRFILGAHYPTDVLCGWAVGIVVVFFIPWLRKKINNDKVLFPIMMVAGLPGFFFCDSNEFFTGYGILLGASLAFLFEERFVKFESTKNIFRCIIRTVAGGVGYVLLNTLFKLPFSKEFLESGTKAAFLVRTGRYALILFLLVGIYPVLFKYTAKIGKKVK